MGSYRASAIKGYVLLTTIHLVSSDLVSSSDFASGMLIFEKSLLGRMEQFINVSTRRLDALKKLSDNFDAIWEQSWDTGSQVEEDTKERTERDNGQWKRLELVAQWDPFKDVLKDTWSQWSTFIPGKETLVSIHSTLLRLIDVYRLKLDKLAKDGMIRNTPAAEPLRAEDFRNLAITAISEGKFDLAGEMTKVVIDLENDPSLMRHMMRLRTVIAYGRKELNDDDGDDDYDDNDDDEEGQIDDDDALSPETLMEALQLRITWTHDKEKDLEYIHVIPMYDPEEGFITTEKDPKLGIEIYHELCRGKQIATAKNLFCEVRYGTLPYYFWWNVEHLHLDPRITMIYNVITDDESERLKTAVKPELRRAAVISPHTGESAISKNRLARHAWLDTSEADTLVKNIARRLTEVTGLDCDLWAEDLQVAVYGIGGLYVPHFDSDIKFKRGETRGRMMGDRLATLMIYLSDVTAGGATVFPLLKVAAFPVKNAALFWYNLNDDGEQVMETLHGGCPVLLGHKWVANKWIHEYGQEFHHPCSLKAS